MQSKTAFSNNSNMIAFCGIDCNQCRSYLATQSQDPANLAEVAAVLSKRYKTVVKPEYVICDGCRSGNRHSYFCRNFCKMRTCCLDRGFDSCIECSEYPCRELQSELDNNPEARRNLEDLRK